MDLFLLAVTVLGMVPPLSGLDGLAALILLGKVATGLWVAGAGLTAWVLMSSVYLPMLRWYGMPATLAPLLPITAPPYTMMTVDSALRWWRATVEPGRAGGPTGPSASTDRAVAGPSLPL